MADISLKNGAGSAVTYGGVTQLKVPAADGGEDVVFQLPPVMQEKAVTITANGTTSVVPDEGKDGLRKVDVTVNVAGGGAADNAILGAVYAMGKKTAKAPAGWSLGKYPAATAKVPKEIEIISVGVNQSYYGDPAYNLSFLETTDYTVDTSNAEYNTVTVGESNDQLYINNESKEVDVTWGTYLLIRFRYTGLTGTKNGNAYDAVLSDLTPWSGRLSFPWAVVNITPLKTVVIQKNMPIPDWLFAYQSLLEKIVFPPVVSSIASQAWVTCRKLAEFDFSQATVIPQLTNTSVFSDNSLPSNYVIKVPAALYDDWIAAEKWSDSAVVSHIVAV